MAFGKHCTHGLVTTRSWRISDQAATNCDTVSQLRESRLVNEVGNGEECWRCAPTKAGRPNYSAGTRSIGLAQSQSVFAHVGQIDSRSQTDIASALRSPVWSRNSAYIETLGEYGVRARRPGESPTTLIVDMKVADPVLRSPHAPPLSWSSGSPVPHLMVAISKSPHPHGKRKVALLRRIPRLADTFDDRQPAPDSVPATTLPLLP